MQSSAVKSYIVDPEEIEFTIQWLFYMFAKSQVFEDFLTKLKQLKGGELLYVNAKRSSTQIEAPGSLHLAINLKRNSLVKGCIHF